MTKKTKSIEGIIFAIPLFMPKDDWDLKIKLKNLDKNKDYVFGRVIENDKGSGVLVEIFSFIGSIETEVNEILKSNILFRSLYIYWTGVMKKRWKIVGETFKYDKYKHSDFANINIVFGFGDDMRLRNYGTKQKTKINREEANKYDFGITWFPIDLENRIIKKMNYLEAEL